MPENTPPELAAVYQGLVAEADGVAVPKVIE